MLQACEYHLLASLGVLLGGMGMLVWAVTGAGRFDQACRWGICRKGQGRDDEDEDD